MRTLLAASLIVLVFTLGAQAQILENHFSLDSITAADVNPAHFKPEPKWGFALGMGGELKANSWNLPLMREYGNRDLDESDKDVILKATNDDFLRVSMMGSPYVGVTYENYGFKVAGRVFAQGQAPSDFLKLALKGNELDEKFSFADSNFEAAGYIETSAAVSFPVDDFVREAAGNIKLSNVRVGANIKHLTGAGFARLEGKGALLTKSDGQIEADGEARYAHSTSGSGFAVDLGVSAEVTERLQVDASILNLGQITWRDVEHGSAGFTAAFNISDPDSADFDYTTHDAEVGPNVTWKLPRTFRVGSAYKWTNEVTALADLSWTKSEAMGLLSRQAVGVEYAPWAFLPTQAVLVKETKQPLRLDLSAGLRFRYFRMNAHLINALSLVSTQAEGAGFGLSAEVRF